MARASLVGSDDSGRANTSSGLEVTHEGDTGDITIDVEDLDITTEGTAVLTDQIGTLAHGIYSRHDGSGDIVIDARGGFIKDEGQLFLRHLWDSCQRGRYHDPHS